jgi:HEPN domain-containing protein
MKEIVAEWYTKACSDLKSAQILLREGIYDTSCFHAQQAVEKILKAFLIKRDFEIEKTHDLVKLIEDCSRLDSSFENLRNSVSKINSYAIDARYPTGHEIDKQEASDALNEAEKTMDIVRNYL